MFNDRRLVEERVEQLIKRLAARCFRVVAPLETSVWAAPSEPVPFGTAVAGDYVPIHVGDRWGPAWSTWWFRVQGAIPDEARELNVELRMDLGFVGDWAGNQSEALVFSRTGLPLKGLNPMNRTVPLTFGSLAPGSSSHPPIVGEGGSVDIYVEAGANPNMGLHMHTPSDLGDVLTRPDTPVWAFGGAELVVRNDDVWELWLDCDVLAGLMKELPEDSTRRAVILRGLEDVADVIDDEGIDTAVERAREILAPLIDSDAGQSAQVMSAVGHAHIDSAWLWPLRETRRKVQRTFSNVLTLMDAYPEFTFACTSAQHYAWLKADAPEIFDRVRAAITRGQWHVVGGMWVESDTNLPGGEALVRQFTVGSRWMESELGVRPTCLWLPDSFGYSGALPQIAALAGMDSFFTQKPSWNQTNTLPHHTFWWEGIDGTRIFTHFPPVDCYDSIVSPEEVKKAERNFKEKGRASASLLPFGYGDGGGGPTAEMIERAKRFANLEEAPRLIMDSPDEFFDRARKEYPSAPVWTGEMYLEFHRGVYTSQAELKRGNREVEALLWVAEWLGVEVLNRGAKYPGETLDLLWQRMLLLQFHDILPGSSTSWVNREARTEYDALREELEALIGSLLSDLSDEEAGEETVVNPLPYDRREVISIGGENSLLQVPKLSACGLASVRVEPEAPVSIEQSESQTVLDNGHVRAVIGAGGTLVSLLDLSADRELVASGSEANLLVVHPDRPSCFDAWELQDHYQRTRKTLDSAVAVRIVENGPVRVSVEATRHCGESTFTQTYTLDADSPRLDMSVHVSWHERHRVLRVEFPLDIDAAHDRSEVQFGHVDRPIDPNTSWDQARFEVCGHRWSLLGDSSYSVAFANSQTYGHNVVPLAGGPGERRRGVTFGYTLLRSPEAPDPTADGGEHDLRYSLVVGADVASAVLEGARLNQPLRLTSAGARISPLVEVRRVPGDALAVIDAIKPADDRSGDLIIRLHEAEGRRGTAHVWLRERRAHLEEVDLHEQSIANPSQRLTWGDDDTIAVELHPFQILTMRISDQ